jgi:hypothetical protein
MWSVYGLMGLYGVHGVTFGVHDVLSIHCVCVVSSDFLGGDGVLVLVYHSVHVWRGLIIVKLKACHHLVSSILSVINLTWLSLNIVEASRVSSVVKVCDLLVDGSAFGHKEIVLSVRVLGSNIVISVDG